MITDYHIQLITRKMDELLAGQKELIDLLKAERQIITQTTQLEVTMEQEETKIDNQAENAAEQTPNESVTITQDIKPDESTAPEKEASKTKESGKKFNKTKAFKDYQAAGGTLSWNKWKAAGMPLEP